MSGDLGGYLSYRLTAQADLGVMFDAEIAAHPQLQFMTLDIQKRWFEQCYEHCASTGFEIDGIAVGGAIYDGEEFHIAVLPAYYGCWGRLWQPTLTWLCSVADPVRARVAKSNTRCLRFADHSRFPRIAEDDKYVTYLGSSQTRIYGKRLRDPT